MEGKIRTPLELLKASWELFKKVWVKYLLIYLLMGVGAVAIALSFALLVIRGQVLTGEVTQQMAMEFFSSNWPIVLIAFILFVLYASFMSLAGNKLVYSEAENQSVKIGESLSYSLGHFMYYFFVTFVVGLIIILGFILLIAPGIMALTLLSLVPVVFVVEEKHSLSALSRSRELVRGYFWPVLGRLSVLFLIAILISALTNNENLSLISTVLNYIFGLISMGYVYYIYKDLAAIKK